MRLAAALAVFVISLALVAAGCGGDDESAQSAADEWAEGLCTTITTWQDSVREVTDGLDDLSSLSQERFEQARDDIEGATETFRDDLSSLGTPETESGEEARQAVDDFSSTLESESADIEETIDGISGIADLPVVAQDIAASLSSVYSALSTMLASIRTGDAQDELESAFDNADACDDVDF
ncbi:MAG: hypothetical protein ACRDPZ_04840 [Gaiellaceae bacterium]